MVRRWSLTAHVLILHYPLILTASSGVVHSAPVSVAEHSACDVHGIHRLSATPQLRLQPVPPFLLRRRHRLLHHTPRRRVEPSARTDSWWDVPEAISRATGVHRCSTAAQAPPVGSTELIEWFPASCPTEQRMPIAGSLQPDLSHHQIGLGSAPTSGLDVSGETKGSVGGRVKDTHLHGTRAGGRLHGRGKRAG